MHMEGEQMYGWEFDLLAHKAGPEVFSFQLFHGNLMFSMHSREKKEVHIASEDVHLSACKSQSSIIGTVN